MMWVIAAVSLLAVVALAAVLVDRYLFRELDPVQHLALKVAQPVASAVTNSIEDSKGREAALREVESKLAYCNDQLGALQTDQRRLQREASANALAYSQALQQAKANYDSTQHDQAYQDWASQPLPDAAIRLREDADCAHRDHASSTDTRGADCGNP